MLGRGFGFYFCFCCGTRCWKVPCHRFLVGSHAELCDRKWRISGCGSLDERRQCCAWRVIMPPSRVVCCHGCMFLVFMGPLLWYSFWLLFTECHHLPNDPLLFAIFPLVSDASKGRFSSPSRQLGTSGKWVEGNGFPCEGVGVVGAADVLQWTKWTLPSEATAAGNEVLTWTHVTRAAKGGWKFLECALRSRTKTANQLIQTPPSFFPVSFKFLENDSHYFIPGRYEFGQRVPRQCIIPV